MLNVIICLFAIFGLAFLIKDSEGPWGVMSSLRNKLMKNRFVGIFFYELLGCYFCVGFHCGWIVYLLSQKNYSWQFFILWGLAGGVISLMMDALLTRLYRE